MSKRIFHFEVETIESGQRRAYGDSYYHFIIENKSPVDFNEHVILQFCIGSLQLAIPEKRRREMIDNGGGADAHFKSYYTHFEKTGDRKFVYKAVSPSTH